MKRRTALIVFLSAIAARTAGAGTPPAGFADAELFGAAEPTALGYEPGSGNAFALEKGNAGTARVLRRALAGGAVTTALTLACVDPDGERGLLGIAFDPDYLQSASTRWVYLYYTRTSPASGACSIAGSPGSRNRIVRFKEAGGTLTGEQLLLEGPVLNSATNHNGGTLRFAPDKTLFASMGDNDTDADANPRSRDLNDLRGKILRIAGDGSVPSDNPFVGQPGTRPEIWAWGLRNPFRFSIDAATGTPWIADVGENTWEEIDRGVPGADYGFPCYEGNDPFRTCNPDPVNAMPPELVYAHHFTPWPYTGSSITGGPVYRNGNFPASYSGRLFYADYGDHWIRSALVGAGGTLSDVQLFMSDGGGVVDMVQAPNGCLGYVDIIGGSIRETCYTAGSNTAPAVVATATPTSGPAPLTVQFTGSNSSDGDGDTLLYSWAFGDGGSSSAADPPHQYSAGVYNATLSIDDQQGSANSVAVSPPIRIVAGNQAPTPSITQPGSGAHYDAGDTIAYSGSATDPQDGAVPAAGLSWTIVFHHDLHTHPFAGPIDGAASGSFVIPTSGEDATDVWYRIHLTATDSGVPLGAGGQLSSSTFVDVLPNLATITLDAEPAGFGLSVSFSGTQAVAPASFDSVVNFPRAIAAPSPQSANGRGWTFLHWADAVGSPRTIATPSSDTTYTAIFRCTSGCAGLSDQDGDGFAAGSGAGDDCDDLDPSVFPGAPDLCDGKNNDCAGATDDATCADFGGTDGAVNGFDLSLLGRYFGRCSATASSQPWAAADLTKDGCLDGVDLAVMAAVWGCSGTAPLCP